MKTAPRSWWSWSCSASRSQAEWLTAADRASGTGQFAEAVALRVSKLNDEVPGALCHSTSWRASIASSEIATFSKLRRALLRSRRQGIGSRQRDGSV